jgi:transposase-like protein
MDKRLTEQQRLAIEWLLAGADVKAVARLVGVHRNTVYYWLKQPAFLEALREASADPALQALRAAVGLVRGLRVSGDGEREAKP